MKKIVAIVALLGMSSLIAGCATTTTKDEWTAKDCWSQTQVAIVSGHPDWKPVMYKDGETIAGIGVEVTKEVFKTLGVDTQAKYAGTWDVVQENAKNGLIDAIVALYKTKEREQYLEYSIAYTQDPIVLFLPAGKSFPYTAKESLKGKKGVATVGDSYGQELDDYIVSGALNMTRVATPQEAFAMLKDGKADYFIYSLYAGQKVITEWSLTGLEESSVVSSQPFYIGVSKKSPYAARMTEINAALQKMIDEKTIPTK